MICEKMRVFPFRWRQSLKTSFKIGAKGARGSAAAARGEQCCGLSVRHPRRTALRLIGQASEAENEHE